MKRTAFFLLFFLSAWLCHSQISATGTCKIYKDTYSGINYFCVFNGIDATSSLEYTGSYNSINWYKFSDPATSINNQNQNFNIENGTGYILDVDGTQYTIWVIDYQNYLPQFTSLVPQDKPDEQCYGLILDLAANVPLIQYETTDHVTHTIERKYTLTYNSKIWNNAWEDKVVSQTVVLPQTEINVEQAPLCDTKFKIEGDQFAQDLQLSPMPSIESALYSAVAVEAHITTTTSARTELNEADRPSSTSLTGSAPLDVTFKSNPNTPVALYYKWDIYKGNELLYSRTDEDQRYTFSEYGTYKVKVTVSSDYCDSSDSVQIVVSESALQVPSVFTPDGNGQNDEFRVAYRSLKTFKCWVFNRWGRKVYYWTDPQKGWDGRINGKMAQSGAYLYIIEAEGTDGIKYSRKGTVNLLRMKDN